MKSSIIGRFTQEVENNPNASDYICFVKAIKDQELTQQQIYRLFLRLVPKDDYPDQDATTIVSKFEMYLKRGSFLS